MSTHDPPRPDPGAETSLRFIEELAGSEDAWITITDAARITRTSEAMARRWVASGRLPVKRQLAGINQHTRLVCLSDVAAIRPIIDPMAAISDEIHKLDLLSIPRQQAHIMHDHERLVLQIQQGQQALDELQTNLREAGVQYQQALGDLREHLLAQQEEGQRELVLRQQQHDLLAEQVHQQGNILTQTNHHLMEQGRGHQRDMEALHTTLTDQFTRVQEEGERKLFELDQRLRQQGEQARSDLFVFVQQQEQIQSMVQRVKETLAQLAQDCQRLQQNVAMHEEALLQQGNRLTTVIEERTHEITMTFEQHRGEQDRDKNALNERLGKIQQELKRQVAQNSVQRLDAHDHLIETLIAQLQDESRARQALSELLIQQQGQLQILHYEVEQVRSQAKRAEE